MYPTNHCHICNESLIYDSRKEASVCVKNRDHYILWDDGAISIEIDNVLFEFYPGYNDRFNKCRIFLNQDAAGQYTNGNYSLDSWVYVDINNYLEVIERVKKLQVFK